MPDAEIETDLRAIGDDRPTLPIVGIGVSAASFASLRTLFATLPARTGAAFVVVSESEAPVGVATLIEALGSLGGLPAKLARDGETLQADHCYVAPDGVMTTLGDGALRFTEPQQRAGHRGTIDTFLISLADEQARHAIAIVLAALEDTGSVGLAHVKENGGLALAEAAASPSGATPGRVVPGTVDGAAGLADVVGDIGTISVELLRHLAHVRDADGMRSAAILMEEGESRLPAIAAVLRNRTGHDFHGYKLNTFLRRIRRRLSVTRLDSIDDYLEHLRNDPDEAQNLFQDLLIGVTQFFRDENEFVLLAKNVLPGLIAAKAANGEALRLWVLGCATGEEAYSLAILLREALDGVDDPPDVRLFATDIDARALAVARTGRYAQSIEAHVSPERLARWFVREGGTYCVHKDLREMCIFSAHNIVRDAPFSRIDLISCRNLLIYLKSELQDRVIPLFHFALRPNGCLFLGPSENVSRHGKLFQPIGRKHRIFRRLETATRALPEFPLTTRSGGRSGPEAPAASIDRRAMRTSLAHRAERAAERHAPAYVVLDTDYEILNFSGRTGPFLEPAAGVATLGLLNLVHRELRFDLRAALLQVAAQRQAARIGPLMIGAAAGEEARRVSLVVEPLVDEASDACQFLVLFQEQGPETVPGQEGSSTPPSLLRDEHVQRLEGELRTTKDRLQTTIEELESTNEELKSSNEEFQSINEELQSANEELETSKEELQSVNEELQTVNGELAQRVTELGQANSDLKNLLESTQIATLFLDFDLRVKSFTPSVADVFHLIDTDLGRPITHLASRVRYPELEDDIRRVIRTLGIVERQIGAADGPQFLVRVLPYRSLDNFIAGTVLTFLNITETLRAKELVREAEGRVRIANATARIVTWELDARTRQFGNIGSFDTIFGAPPPTTLAAFLALLHPDDQPDVAHAFEGALGNGGAIDIEARLALAAGESWIRLSGTRQDGLLVGLFQDIDDAKRAAAQRSLLMAELQHRVKNILAVVRTVTDRTLHDATTLADFEERFSGRIDSLARTQGLLANRGLLGIELEQIVREELAATSGRGSNPVIVAGPTVVLRDKAAEIFTLALHELATNATKYGALSRPEGQLSVRWRLLNTGDGGRLSLEWIEAGMELDGEPPRSGFGRQLIERGLPYDLGASTSLAFTRNGVHCTVELPLGPFVEAASSRHGRNIAEERTDPGGALR